MYQISKSKFFNEKGNNSHLDSKYGKNQNLQEIHRELKKLLKQFTYICSEKEIKPIIMHGSLIGWYFNRRILPWDNDIDIVLTGKSIENLKKLDNFETEKIIIKVNPNSVDRNNDKNNKIDARVISKENGVFIDITFLYQSLDNNFKTNIIRYLSTIQNTTNPYMRANYENKLKYIVKSINRSEPIESSGYVNCKSPHYYNIKHILPLKKEKFEDCDIFLPSNIQECLHQEYGPDVFKPKFKNWVYDNKQEIWRNRY
jgi:phosphorylcholine metabolism protein LicD